MKKFSKITAFVSAMALCVSMVNFSTVHAEYDEEAFEIFINSLLNDSNTGNGDVNFDGVVDCLDASLALAEYAIISTSFNDEHILTKTQQEVADVDKNGAINAIDASFIMSAYANSASKKEPKIIFKYPFDRAIPSGNFSESQIANSSVKPHIEIETITIPYDEAQYLSLSGEKIPVYIYISGAKKKYTSTGLHVKCGSNNSGDKITVAPRRNGKPDVISGDAIESLATLCEYTDNSLSDIFVATAYYGDFGWDGVMYKLYVNLPDTVKEGDFFPIEIEFEKGDLFTNFDDDEAGRLMQAYLFTQGITNGGIRIEESWETICTSTPSQTTKSTTTQTTTTTTTTTTTPAPDKTVIGDANDDGEMSIADAVLIMQSLSNPEGYSVKKENTELADVVDKGSGLTPMDALAIQMVQINLLSLEDLPTTSEKIQEILDK